MNRSFRYSGDYDRSAKAVEERTKWSTSESCAILPEYKAEAYRKLGVQVGDAWRDFDGRTVRVWFRAVLDAEDEGGLRVHCTLVERILSEYSPDGVRIAWELGGNLEIQTMMVKELPEGYRRCAWEDVQKRLARFGKESAA